ANNKANLRRSISNISLPSIYLSRTDYGDLTASFKQILISCLNKNQNVVTEKLDTDIENLREPILSDVMVQNLDNIQEKLGSLDLKYIQSKPSPLNAEYMFDYLLKSWCLPYAPSRSFTKLKDGLYTWFFNNFNFNYEKIHKLIVCSDMNQMIIYQIIDQAKKQYVHTKSEELQNKQLNRLSNLEFRLSETDYFGMNYELISAPNYAYSECYLRRNRSEPERAFEKFIIESYNIDWWYKNGESRRDYFAVLYEMTNDQGIPELHAFYPDFIVRFKDSKIGIYDTKSGITLEDVKTCHKSNALQVYMSQLREGGLNVDGGIVDYRFKDRFYITRAKQYKLKNEEGNWDTLVF
ncbi:MAG: hypothetical protein OXF77_00960, partial [Thaumarchaeota archaeon]|nr:hypothetical protein [Nitrososphaerota archaeon]